MSVGDRFLHTLRCALASAKERAAFHADRSRLQPDDYTQLDRDEWYESQGEVKTWIRVLAMYLRHKKEKR